MSRLYPLICKRSKMSLRTNWHCTKLASHYDLCLCRVRTHQDRSPKKVQNKFLRMASRCPWYLRTDRGPTQRFLIRIVDGIIPLQPTEYLNNNEWHYQSVSVRSLLTPASSTPSRRPFRSWRSNHSRKRPIHRLEKTRPVLSNGTSTRPNSRDPL